MGSEPIKKVARTQKILIAESTPVSFRRLVSLFLETPDVEQVEIFSAFTFDMGMETFRDKHPDLIIINTHLQDGLGKELCRRIRREEGERHTGIIFLSNQQASSDNLAVECLEMGADDFLLEDCSDIELRARVKSVLRLKAMTDELRTANHKLHLLSLTDELTGLHNMRGFNSHYLQLLKRSRTGDTGFAVIMMDLDHFKNVNDTVNHLMGSFVISEVGKLLRLSRILDPDDIAARYGGDEFIIAFPTAHISEAVAKAEEIRKAIQRQPFHRDGHTVHLTTSLGVCWTPAGFVGKDEDPVKLADAMLYRSKGLGRDRVSSIIPGTEEPEASPERNVLQDGEEFVADELHKPAS